MDRLVALLNEYSVVLWDRYSGVTGEEYPKKWSYGITGPDNPGRYIFYSDNTNLSQTYLISKEYGFIQWLVDNDKIDRKKLEIRPFSDGLVYSDSDCTVKRCDTTYEMLLMLLSISDTPIEDLISYLK